MDTTFRGQGMKWLQYSEADPLLIDPPIAWVGLAMVHQAQHEIAAAFESEQNELMEVEEHAVCCLNQCIAFGVAFITMDLEANDHTDNVEVIIPVPEMQSTNRRRSKVWKEFLILEGKESTDGIMRAICTHCKTHSFKADSYYGTSSLKKHLDKCEAYRQSVKLEGNSINTFDQKTSRELISRAIIKHGYAFSWIEHEGNREIHVYLNNQVKTIRRNTAKSDVLKMHASLKAKLKNTLRDVPGRICLTSDMWTSCQTKGHMCLTAHYVDANWKLNSKVLNFCHIESPHTGQNLYSAVLNLLQDWGIEHKIFSITLDNASSNDKMQDYLRSTLKDQELLLYDGLYFHVRCAAHVLNLIVTDGLKMINSSVVKIRESVKYVKWFETRKKAFLNCVKLARISETKTLWLDVPTRWNSTYMMLDRALLYRNSFKELVNVDPMYKYFPVAKEWEMVEKIRDVLEPFADITELFSGSDYPTSNLYFENVWKIAMLLKDLVQSDDLDLRKMAENMKGKFDKYWANTKDDDYTMVFAFAVVLDPRCKLPMLSYCYDMWFEKQTEAVLKISDVRFRLGILLKEYDSKFGNGSCVTRKTNTHGTSGNHKRKFDYLAAYRNKEGMHAHQDKTKLDLYLDDPIEDHTIELNILDFWKDNEVRYGKLAHLARDVLSVPLTTVASESTFSIGGRVLNKWRSSYLPQNVEALITTRSWLYGYESTLEDDFTGSDVDWNATNSLRGHCQ